MSGLHKTVFSFVALQQRCCVCIRCSNTQTSPSCMTTKRSCKPGEEHPDKCSCTCARLKALLEAIDRAMAGPTPVLVGTEECKTALTSLVKVVAEGGAHSILSDISLKTAASRSPEQSPYEITLTSSTEGHMMRAALLGVSQPNATPNIRDNPVKSWEVRAYRPRRGGLIRELQG